MSVIRARLEPFRHGRLKRKRPGECQRISAGTLRVCKFNQLEAKVRERVLEIVGSPALKGSENSAGEEHHNIHHNLVVEADRDVLRCVEQVLDGGAAAHQRQRKQSSERRTRIRWPDVRDRALRFADHLESSQDELRHRLSDYECANVVEDEVWRAVDLLRHLERNREYFTHEIRGGTAFLPLNQPIYASVCFGAVPALMSQDVVIRPPTAMHATYQKLNECLQLESYFPTLRVSYELDKQKFCRVRSRVTEAVIFTGTPENGDVVRRQFRPETLFILNGSGHNPLVITETADVENAIASSLRVVLQNQGQDCAGPNALLVHRRHHAEFLRRLIAELKSIEPRCGHYSEPGNIVGPNTDPEAPLRVAKRLVDIAKDAPGAVVYGGTLRPSERMIWPTVIDQPLRDNAPLRRIGLREWFAPIFHVQAYETDGQLRWYFEHPAYHENAMYVSLFGESPYVRSLVERGLHTPDNLLVDTDLHEVERGYLPYGGLGMAASHIAFRGVQRAGATLPQREIHEFLVQGHVLQG